MSSDRTPAPSSPDLCDAVAAVRAGQASAADLLARAQAVADSPAASEPDPGSVSAQAPSFSPAASGRSQRSCCAGLALW